MAIKEEMLKEIDECRRKLKEQYGENDPRGEEAHIQATFFGNFYLVLLNALEEERHTMDVNWLSKRITDPSLEYSEKRRGLTRGEFYSRIRALVAQTGVDEERLCFLSHYVNNLGRMELERQQKLMELEGDSEELSKAEKVYRRFFLQEVNGLYLEMTNLMLPIYVAFQEDGFVDFDIGSG